VPQVLIADDNSNIHRAATLALKEVGVDVVAVGNGEAAVRKIAEIKPDLVLADIFMPVRSGYEVCEFVKKDPRFSRIPVVLLVGAFDPFDEREAQRVQSDAILKKPFVPPDSLLRVVADLLAQAAAQPASAPATSSAPATDKTTQPAAAPAVRESAPEFMDAPPEEFAPAKARLELNANDQPVAFGTLLEASGESANVDDTVVTSQRDPTLGEPAFWAPKASAEQAEDGSQDSDAAEETSDSSSASANWRPDVELETLPPLIESTSAEAAPEALLEAHEELLELPELALPAVQSAQKPAETQPDLNQALPPLPEIPQFDPPQREEVEKLSVPDPSPLIERTEEIEPTTAAELTDFAWATPAQPDELSIAPPQPAAPSDTSAAQAKNDPAAQARPALETLAPFLASITSAASTRGAGLSELFDFEPPAQSADASGQDAFESSPESIHLPAAPLDPSLIEAIAQRVIERMQPQVIELVTRELLRPAVEALVQRELEKK
jgi:CheY-like chemotaxis protein